MATRAAVLLSVLATASAFGPLGVSLGCGLRSSPACHVSTRPQRAAVRGLRMSISEEDEAKKMMQTNKAVADQKAMLEAIMGSKGGVPKQPSARDNMTVKTDKQTPSKPKDVMKTPQPIADFDRSPPPKSFAMCVDQAYISCEAAIRDGKKLIEVEFPPLPQQALDNGALGADVILDAQISHARQFARYFNGKNVAIVFADIVERNRFMGDTSFGGKSSKMVKDKLYDTVSDNVRYSALGGGYKGSFIERLWVKQEYVPDVEATDDVFVIIGASAQELPDVRKFCEAAGDRPVILFNMKLQTLRGDFGLPAFPGKSLHYDWLCTAFPAYHVLPRQYTRTIPKPPFLINYSGCLFRTYPGKWQVLLEVPDTEKGGGKYERVRLEAKRPALSELREVLAQELQLDGLDNNEKGDKKIMGVDLATLRAGVVVKTWWEQDVDKTVSDDWRN